jgi:hypothetical protein
LGQCIRVSQGIQTGLSGDQQSSTDPSLHLHSTVTTSAIVVKEKMHPTLYVDRAVIEPTPMLGSGALARRCA